MSPVDRSRLPEPGPDRPFRFPRIAARRLPNGLEVRAVSHRSVPLVSMALLVPGGSAVDPPDRPGLVSMTSGLLDEGSRGQSALEVAARVARIGADLGLDVTPDAVVLTLTALDRFLDAGLSLVHEIATAPNLTGEDFTRIRNLRLERLRQMKDHSAAMAERAFAAALYGRHAYGHLAAGTEPSLAAMTVDDTRAMHAALFAPAGSTLVIVGNRDEEALLDAASGVFGAWTALPASLTVDRAAAGGPVPPADLRLGVVPRTGFDQRRGAGPFVVQTSVGTDVTIPAVREVLLELRGIGTSRPPTADELVLARASLCKGYPRGFETAAQVARSVAHLALHGLPDSHFEDFIPGVLAVSAGAVTAAAQQYLDLDKMTTLIVGDLDTLENSLVELGLGPHQVLNT